jgi:diguanylate cyclase (GGDEF)-like protein
MSRAAPRFGSLRTRLAVLYAGLFAVAMLCVSAALYAVVERNAEIQVRRELVASGAVFDRLWSQRSDQMRDAAGLMARDFGFRSAVATHDARTIESALANLRSRLGLRMAFIVDVDGNVFGLPNPAIAAEARTLAAGLDYDPASGVTVLGGGARHIVAAPIMAPALSGWVFFSVDLDAHEMRSLEQMSAIPLSATVYQRLADGSWALGEQAGIAADRRIGRFLAESRALAAPSTLDAPASSLNAAGTAVALVKPLPALPGAPETVLLLQYPLARALAAYRPLQIAIALFGLVGLLLVVMATWRMARSITRPISLLDRAASRLAEGDSVTVDIDSDDEIGRLAKTFNRMAEEIRERERRIAHLAFNDVLTGLPNRALFHEQLDRELRLAERRSAGGTGGGVALLCLDLDDFKSVNDTLGHAIGDALLKEVATRLADLPDEVFAARLGADEFVVLAPVSGGDIEAVAALGRRLIAMLDVGVRIAGHEIEPRTSIGIAVSPSDGQDAETLLRNADLALHQAKDAGRHTLRFFEPALNARAQARRSIETDLRKALQNGELELFFQPLFDVAQRKITEFERPAAWHYLFSRPVPGGEVARPTTTMLEAVPAHIRAA